MTREIEREREKERVRGRKTDRERETKRGKKREREKREGGKIWKLNESLFSITNLKEDFNLCSQIYISHILSNFAHCTEFVKSNTAVSLALNMIV